MSVLNIFSLMGVAALNDFLYVCGGMDDDSAPLDIVERYCPATDEWEMMSSMHWRRHSQAVVAFQDCIYAIGGNDEYNTLNSVCRQANNAYFRRP